jgi:ribokinase
LNLNEVSGNQVNKVILASKDLANLGVNTVITTLGNKGSILYRSDKKEVIEIPAYKVTAVDTVGAGDCYNGVLASKLCQGENIINAVKYATAACSIAVTRKGAQESMPFTKEIHDRFIKISSHIIK